MLSQRRRRWLNKKNTFGLMHRVYWDLRSKTRHWSMLAEWLATVYDANINLTLIQYVLMCCSVSVFAQLWPDGSEAGPVVSQH